MGLPTMIWQVITFANRRLEIFKFSKLFVKPTGHFLLGQSEIVK